MHTRGHGTSGLVDQRTSGVNSQRGKLRRANFEANQNFYKSTGSFTATIVPSRLESIRQRTARLTHSFFHPAHAHARLDRTHVSAFRQRGNPPSRHRSLEFPPARFRAPQVRFRAEVVADRDLTRSSNFPPPREVSQLPVPSAAGPSPQADPGPPWFGYVPEYLQRARASAEAKPMASSGHESSGVDSVRVSRTGRSDGQPPWLHHHFGNSPIFLLPRRSLPRRQAHPSQRQRLPGMVHTVHTPCPATFFLLRHQRNTLSAPTAKPCRTRPVRSFSRFQSRRTFGCRFLFFIVVHIS